MAYVHMQTVHKGRSVMGYTTRSGARSHLHERNLAPFLMFLLIGVLSAHFCESAEVAAESNEGDRVSDLEVELFSPGAYAESETGDESFSARKVKAVVHQEGNSVRHSQGEQIERLNVIPNQVSGLQKEMIDLVTSEQGLIGHAGHQREMLESNGGELSIHDAVRALQNGGNIPQKLAVVGSSGRRMLQRDREWHATRMHDVIHGKEQGGSSNQRRELLLTAANHTALSPTPPMGWNPWNFVGCGNWNETLFYQTASFLNTSGMASLGYEYVNIDDCWMSDARDSEGDLTWNTTRFPSGLPALASYVHSLGLKLGLYLCAGTMTCGLKPGSLNYESRDISLVSSWGIDLVKVDNCYDEDIIPETRYTRFTDAIAATGRQILFMMCNWGEYIPARFASPISNTWRTTYDLKNSYGFMLNMSDWNDLTHAYASPSTGWNDPDMLQIGNGNMTLDEQYTHMTLWAIMKAPLLIGTNLLNMTNETAALLTNPEVLRINQDPLGIQGFKRTTEQGKEVWAGVLSGGAIAVALVNRNAGPANITLQWANVNLTSDVGVRIRDVWARSYLTGLFTSSYTTSVNGHGAKLFVLQPAVQIAFNKTANASAVYADQLPDFGNDANVRTFWQSTDGPFQVGNPYWQVDLGQPSPISSLELVARQDADETSARANYQFRCSNSSNGSNYTVIASQGSVPKEPYSTFAAVVPGTSICRYVRVAKMDGTAFSFAELRLYKSENVVTI